MDYEKLRKKREAEADRKREIANQERREIEEKERQRVKRALERKRYDQWAMSKQNQKKAHEIEEAERHSKEFIEMLEKKKEQSEQA